jgi:cell division protein FtsI (penicillin-binding protein 3)
VINLGRVGVVHGAFVCFALALVGRAAWVQLGETARWRAQARGQQVAAAAVPATRGAILDASGNVLVQSRAVVRLPKSVSQMSSRKRCATRACPRSLCAAPSTAIVSG